MTERDWTYYLDTRWGGTLFREHAFLAHRWDRGHRQWIKLDHMYLPDRLRQGDMYLDEISETRAEALIAGTDADT